MLKRPPLTTTLEKDIERLSAARENLKLARSRFKAADIESYSYPRENRRLWDQNHYLQCRSDLADSERELNELVDEIGEVRYEAVKRTLAVRADELDRLMRPWDGPSGNIPSVSVSEYTCYIHALGCQFLTSGQALRIARELRAAAKKVQGMKARSVWCESTKQWRYVETGAPVDYAEGEDP
jgi:hypothetical protein